jgi:hypothetical protein
MSVENHDDDDDDDDDDDTGWERFLTRPSELSGNSTSRVIREQVRGMDGVRISPSQYLKYLKGSFNMP